MKTFIEHFYHKEKTQIGVSADSSDSKVPEDSLQSQILELIELYRIIQAKVGQAGVGKLKADFSYRWHRLDKEKQKMLVEKLLETKLLPSVVGEVLRIFEGRVISLV